MDLVYCAGGNPRLSAIAAEAGFLLGVRSDRAACGVKIDFVDCNFKKPNFARHLEAVKRYAPKYATVPDLSEDEVSEADVERALQQAWVLQDYCQIVLVVPKISGQLAMLPAGLAVGYSVPTSYGGAQYPLEEAAGRRVHLLGGSPQAQMQVYRSLRKTGEVLSADGNAAQRAAVSWAMVWGKEGKWIKHPDYVPGVKDLYLDCWRQSCENIRTAWNKECALR